MPPTRGQIDILLSLRMTSNVLLESAGVVHRLEDDAGGKRTVADDRDAVSRSSASRSSSSPLFRPSAVDTLQPAWPVMNRS